MGVGDAVSSPGLTCLAALQGRMRKRVAAWGKRTSGKSRALLFGAPVLEQFILWLQWLICKMGIVVLPSQVKNETTLAKYTSCRLHFVANAQQVGAAVIKE